MVDFRNERSALKYIVLDSQRTLTIITCKDSDLWGRKQKVQGS